ncbi:6844_t:CDS:2, partial [Acaulospora morrowiae]
MFNEFTIRIGGNPETEEGREFLTSCSPLTRADNIIRPLLIAQGQNDPRVKRSESDQIVEKLVSKSIPVGYILYTDEGHGFARPANSLSFYSIVEKFLARYLGGRYEEFGNAFKDAKFE